MRRCYLVCYDIRNPKRLKRVNTILKGYGEALQLSVFFCFLKSIDRVRLQTDLEEEMNQKDDQVLIFDLGPDEKKAREAIAVIGQPLPEPNGRIMVI